MAAPKTIVITIPKELSGTPFVLPRPLDPTTAIASKQLSDILSGNFVQVIKEEHTDKMMNDGDKPARKRQRLDHLSMEEKIMRRKLKNRVAAQTARDRKKLRMDQLEAQVTELTEHINELNELTAILTEQNTQLVEKNEALQIVMSKCTCGTTGSQVDEDVNRSVEAQNLVFEGVKIPVTSQIVGSAVSLPQQRAICAMAAVRILVLSALCYQWARTVVHTHLKTALNASSLKNLLFLTQLQISAEKPLNSRWWGPHQQAWNPVGT